jgi:hypothetical protein
VGDVEPIDPSVPAPQRQDFQRHVATYVFVSAVAVGIWVIQGADGVVTIRHRDVGVGFWPAWPIVIGLLLVARSAWLTFAHSADD